MEQNLCPNCSKPVLDTEEICPNCGAIIGTRQAKPLTKRAIQSKPQNMMAASPKKARPRGVRPVSPRAQTEVSPGGQRRRPPQGQGRPAQGRPGQGQQRPKRRPSGQYMHSPDSRYGEGIERPTRGQMLEKKPDYTTYIVIAAFVIAVIVIVVVMSSDTKAAGGEVIDNPTGEVVSDEEVNPVTKLFNQEKPRVINGYLEIALNTDGVLSAPQIEEVKNFFKEQFKLKDTALTVVGSDLLFTEWQQLGGKVKFLFIRKIEKNFDTYHTDEIAVTY